MRLASSAFTSGSLVIFGFVLLSFAVCIFGSDKKETNHAAAAQHVVAAKHVASSQPQHPVAAQHAAADHHTSDPKHPSAASAAHANAHAPETKHSAPAPVVKLTDEANNIYSVCVERDVLPAPDNAPKDKLKAIAAKCDECGTAKCKDKCGGKEVNDDCRTCITKNCPSAK